ncbi:hypothetical protein Hdeb2414_s0019g00540111 [Helianthus debilis subsp. tardiflorus]
MFLNLIIFSINSGNVDRDEWHFTINFIYSSHIWLSGFLAAIYEMSIGLISRYHQQVMHFLSVGSFGFSEMRVIDFGEWQWWWWSSGGRAVQKAHAQSSLGFSSAA